MKPGGGGIPLTRVPSPAEDEGFPQAEALIFPKKLTKPRPGRGFVRKKRGRYDKPSVDGDFWSAAPERKPAGRQ